MCENIILLFRRIFLKIIKETIFYSSLKTRVEFPSSGHSEYIKTIYASKSEVSKLMINYTPPYQLTWSHTSFVPTYMSSSYSLRTNLHVLIFLPSTYMFPDFYAYFQIYWSHYFIYYFLNFLYVNERFTPPMDWFSRWILNSQHESREKERSTNNFYTCLSKRDLIH